MNKIFSEHEYRQLLIISITEIGSCSYGQSVCILRYIHSFAVLTGIALAPGLFKLSSMVQYARGSLKDLLEAEWTRPQTPYMLGRLSNHGVAFQLPKVLSAGDRLVPARMVHFVPQNLVEIPPDLNPLIKCPAATQQTGVNFPAVP